MPTRDEIYARYAKIADDNEKQPGFSYQPGQNRESFIQSGIQSLEKNPQFGGWDQAPGTFHYVNGVKYPGPAQSPQAQPTQPTAPAAPPITVAPPAGGPISPGGPQPAQPVSPNPNGPVSPFTPPPTGGDAPFGSAPVSTGPNPQTPVGGPAPPPGIGTDPSAPTNGLKSAAPGSSYTAERMRQSRRGMSQPQEHSANFTPQMTGLANARPVQY